MEDPRQQLTSRSDVRAILVDGLSDWVDLGMMRQYVSDEIGEQPPAVLREATLDLLRRLLVQNLVIVGDVDADFVRWTLEPAEALNRISSEWSDPESALRPGDVCWLANTSTGDALARTFPPRRT